MTKEVHVVSFSPAGDQGGVGGFEWRYDFDEAVAEYDRQVAESKECEGSHNVRLLTVVVANTTTTDGVTSQLERNIDDLEDALPALRQYIPADSMYVPSGGILNDQEV